MTKLLFSFAIFFLSLHVARAGDIDPSGFSLYSGGEFYVLTDGVFSSEQNIEVRFEAGGNTKLAEYGGVDVRLYRIPKPLEYLKAQKNLHRPDVKNRSTGTGLSQVLSYLWDSWYKKTRLAWQRVFSPEARKTATAAAPALKQAPAHSYQTKFSKEPQFAPLKGFELVDAFRYPVWQAKPNEPPKDTRIEGSSSNFIQTRAGNVILPMGKRKPGLYLVEAMIGSYRATTLAFVSDSIAVTKVSSEQALVWTVHRGTGMSRAKSTVILTDGVGVLEHGVSGADGVFIAKRPIPERTFAMVEDQDGGIALSENFFYDSEVYQPKVYLFTDRPLYQPGDLVSVRAFGRNLGRQGSKDLWSKLTGGTAKLTVADATGLELFTRKFYWDASLGGEGEFRLPETAVTGGYSLKLTLDGEDYGAVFRVARFTKPHFDAQIVFDKPAYKVGELVKGRVILTYPSGQPVAQADVDLQLRSEQMSMFEGSYAYGGSLPVELSESSYKSNALGEVAFTFPAATKPSRYIASARAMDGAAFRVSTKKVTLIEGFLETYVLNAAYNATEPGATLTVAYDRQGKDGADVSQPLSAWQAIRLEDRSVLSGKVAPADRGEFAVKFEKSGHYILRVVDGTGVTRGTRSHVVLGPDLKSTTGQLEILMDRESYSIGETATLILTFPFKADDALLTLERNNVESHGRLAGGGGWFRAKRLGDSQWKVEVPVTDMHAPNIIFSAAYARNGDFGFQNKGLAVKKPMIDIRFKANKPSYLPGEKVIVEVETTLSGKPVAGVVAVGVVDEMIYVLQPEIVPSIGEFFHYQRRNQVRTTSSISFYSFNPAVSEAIKTPAPSAGRDLKLMQERARRDSRDTAYWNGKLKTGADGKARFEFVMPDALTRWRITGRAIALEGADPGTVGEAKGFLLSNKDYYLKWTGPTRFRAGDQPKAAVVTFNSTNTPVEAEVLFKGQGYSFSHKLTMRPGANTVVLDSAPEQSILLDATIMVGGKAVDILQTSISFETPTWTQPQSKLVRLDSATKLELPAGASRLKLKILPNSEAQFLRIVDDLLEYPWGSVEQTSSRLIPLSIAVSALTRAGAPENLLREFKDRIAADRRRLIAMAGPQATFSWWGDMSPNLLMTAHAYHADWRASNVLGLTVPKADWEYLLKLYAEVKDSSKMDRAYALWVLSRLGLPIQEQAKTLEADLAPESTKALTAPRAKEPLETASAVLESEVETERALATLTLRAAAGKGFKFSPSFARQVDSILKSPWSAPVMQAAVLAGRVAEGGLQASASEVEKILDAVRLQSPTIDRALALAFVEQAQPVNLKASFVTANLGKAWAKTERGPLSIFNWRVGAVPATLDLPAMPGAVVEVQYEKAESPKSTMDVAVSRQLYLLTFVGSGREGGDLLQRRPVGAGEAFDSHALYLDEITVTAKAGAGRLLLLEVPLPPGGEVEPTVWGLEFQDVRPNFSEVRPSSSGMGYSVPIETLGGETKHHQLVRFSSRGRFELPPARLFKMYRPAEQAFEGGVGKRVLTVQ